MMSRFVSSSSDRSLVRNTGARAMPLALVRPMPWIYVSLHPLLAGTHTAIRATVCSSKRLCRRRPHILRLRRNVDGRYRTTCECPEAANYRRLPYAVNLNAVRYPNMPSIASATSSIDAIPSTVRISPSRCNRAEAGGIVMIDRRRAASRLVGRVRLRRPAFRRRTAPPRQP